MKINIDDMLRAGLDIYPRNESLLEVRDWMNRLVNRTTFEASQSEDESPMLMLTMADDKDGSEPKETSKETDEPQPDIPTESLTQMFLDPAFMKEVEMIERKKQVINSKTILCLIDELIIDFRITPEFPDEPLPENRCKHQNSQYSIRSNFRIRIWFCLKRRKTPSRYWMSCSKRHLSCIHRQNY